MVGCQQMPVVGVRTDEGSFIFGYTWYQTTDDAKVDRNLAGITCGYPTISPAGNWICRDCAYRGGYLW